MPSDPGDFHPPPRIHARGLTFQPDGPGGGTVLRDVAFDVAPGGTLLVAGETGTGKSMLLRLIAGLGGTYPDPRAGGSLRVLYGDEGDVDEEGPQGSARAGEGAGEYDGPCLPPLNPGRVVFVPQAPRESLLGLDVFSALALPLEERGLPAGETLRRLEDALVRLDLLRLLDRDVSTLSSGEARRVALAGVLAQRAPLVLLDEPLSDLDPTGVRAMREDMARLAGSCTMVVAEHRAGFLADLADRTLHLVAAQPRPKARTWPVPEGLRAQASQAAEGVTARDLVVERGGRRLVEAGRLEMAPGVWGLIGPNGSGKTSLLETLAGLAAPAEGTVSISGVPVWRRGRRVRPLARYERRLRRVLQVAFQEPREAFFAPSVREELAAPLAALTGATAASVAGHVEGALDGHGRAGLLERAPQRLSGGEARLVQLSGALLPGPRVLFLDEPSHGLDVSLRAGLRGLLRELTARDCVVVVATHEPDLLPEDARWVFLRGDGRVVVGADARPGAPAPAAAGYVDVPGRRGPGAQGVHA